MEKSQYDVLIVGGSHAGLSAAMAIGRMDRTALLVDAGSPRNEFSKHANNIAGMDGINPDQWRSQAREDLKKYDAIEFVHGKVLGVKKVNKIFQAWLDSDVSVEAHKVILAYGVKDKLPDIKGIWDQWGKAVLHCPYCHGYEFKDRVLGVVGNGSYVEHMLPMIRSLSDKLVVFMQGESQIPDEFAARIRQHHILIIETPIASLKQDDGTLKALILNNGEEIVVDALFVAPVPPLEMNATIAEDLGCEKDDIGFIKVEKTGSTSVKGVFAAGDIMTMQQSVISAASTGQIAGSGAVFELVNEAF